MTDTDRLITEQVVPFREKILDIVKDQHQYIYTVANNILAGHKNMVGLQVTQNGQVVGEYTFHLDGLHIESVDTGKLDSGINHPFLGLVKPYGVMEQSVIEQVVKDETISTELLKAMIKYLPDTTIKFLR
ncbi:hypothetical protein [Sporomusa aerivorans]|uniref:hypothetical protein n=1 Tax=Sporomusa aerivorans TaxID=204936 RepID=UPI00352B82A2